MHVGLGMNMILCSCPPGNGASLHTDDWLPSLGWRPAPHHLNSTKLWATIQQEAKDDAVCSCATMASPCWCNALHAPSFASTSEIFDSSALVATGQGAGLGELPASEYHFTFLPRQGNGSPFGQQAVQQDPAWHPIDAAHIRGLQG